MERERRILFNLRDLLTVIFKHKYPILIIFFVIASVNTVRTLLLPSIYAANSSLLVQLGRENLYSPEVGDLKANLGWISYNREAAINADIKVLQSTELIEKVISDLGVEKVYPDSVIPSSETGRERSFRSAVNRFENSLSVRNVPKSNVIEVSLEHKNPQIAAEALNRLVVFFQERHLEVLSKPRADFFESQLVTYRQQLKKSEDDLDAFKAEHNVYSFDEQRSLLLFQRKELDETFKANQNRIAELEQKLSFLKNQLKILPENEVASVTTNEFQNFPISQGQTELLKLQLQEQELLEKYKENNRAVVNIRQRIRLVNDYIEKQENPESSLEIGTNNVYKQTELEAITTEAELVSLEAKDDIIVQQLSHVNEELKSLDLRESEFRNLKRELETNENNYKNYVDKFEEARVAEVMDKQKMANISIIQKATVPMKPVKPRRAFNIAVGVLLAAASGFAFALFSEFYISQGLTTPAQAERILGIPVLSTIPYKEIK